MKAMLLDSRAPRPSVEQMQARLADELTIRSRIAYILLLLCSLAVLGVVSSLWLTEPDLPQRTHIAFGALCLGSLIWATFSIWTLSRRKVLLARNRMISGWIAVAFTGFFTTACVLTGLLWETQSSSLPTAAFAASLMAAACVMLWRARRAYHELALRYARLQSEVHS